MPTPRVLSLTPLLDILAEVQGQMGDNLLNDFLNCTNLFPKALIASS